MSEKQEVNIDGLPGYDIVVHLYGKDGMYYRNVAHHCATAGDSLHTPYSRLRRALAESRYSTNAQALLQNMDRSTMDALRQLDEDIEPIYQLDNCRMVAQHQANLYGEPIPILREESGRHLTITPARRRILGAELPGVVVEIIYPGGKRSQLVTPKPAKPLYEHDCATCTYLGTFSGWHVKEKESVVIYDLYHHDRGDLQPPILSARYGSSGHECITEPEDAAPIHEARVRARSYGLTWRRADPSEIEERRKYTGKIELPWWMRGTEYYAKPIERKEAAHSTPMEISGDGFVGEEEL